MQTNTTPYQKIALASRTTGLSQYFLRKGCKEGTIHHIRSGTTNSIHIPALLEQITHGGAAQ